LLELGCSVLASGAGPVDEKWFPPFEIANEPLGVPVPALVPLAPAQPPGNPVLLGATPLVVDHHASAIHLAPVRSVECHYMFKRQPYIESRSRCRTR